MARKEWEAVAGPEGSAKEHWSVMLADEISEEL